MGARVSFPDDRGISDRFRVDRRFRSLNVRTATAMVTVSVALTFLSLLSAGMTVRQLGADRAASCAATLTSLAAIAETSAAGIRRVVASVPNGISLSLAASFRLQQRQTRAENARRRAVVVSANLSAKKLRASAFCN